MKKTQDETVNIIDLDELTGELAPIEVFGWTIDKLPPKILDVRGYGASPTKQELLAVSTTLNYPVSTLTPSSPAGKSEGNLAAVGFSGQLGTSPNGQPFWGFTYSPDPFRDGGFTFRASSPVDFNVKIVVQLLNALVTATEWPTLFINGVDFSQVNTKVVYDSTNLTLTYPIQVGLLKAAGSSNLLGLVNNNQYSNLNISKITLSGHNVPVTASYYWESLLRSELDSTHPDVSLEKGLVSGDSSSKTESRTFEHSIGIKVGVEAPLKYAKISAELSYSFTTSSTKAHTIKITQENSTAINRKYVIAEGQKSCTLQVWQLHIVFSTDGEIIDEVIPEGDCPIFRRTFIVEGAKSTNSNAEIN